MELREGDRIRKKESGMIYEVRKIHEKGLVILSSEDGLRTALMSVKNVGLYFSSVPRSVKD